MRRWLGLMAALAIASSGCGTRVTGDEALRYRRSRGVPVVGVTPVTDHPAVPGSTEVESGASGADAGPATTGGGSTPLPDPVKGSPNQSSTAGSGPGGGGPAAGSAIDNSAGSGSGAKAGSPVTVPTTAPAGQGGAAGPKSPIVIGEVGVLSGPIGANMKAIADGVRIWVRSINDRGGINGHPVTLIQGDTGNDPARHRALVQQFVEQKNVVAFVGQPGDVFSGGGSVEYLTTAGVPVIGSEGGANWYYESPVYFPQMPHGRVLVQTLALGTALQMKDRQQTKIALWTCVEAQTCTDVADIFPKVVPRHGSKVVHQSKISIGQPDFTAECLNARNNGAETVAMFADGATISRGAASCARQGYRPSWAIFGAEILAKQHAEDKNLDGALVVDITAPWFLDNTPARKEFVDAAARYAPNLPPGSPMANGWVAGKVFELAAARAAEPLSKTTILQALGALRGDLLPDLTGPLLFNPGKAASPSTCYYNETTRDGRWVSPDGGQRHCPDYDPTI